jgi:transposase, IS30 family
MAGASMGEAAAVVGVSESCAQRWVTKAGGMIADLGEPSGRYLSLAEREEIAAGWCAGLSRAEIARRIGRHRSTVGRELTRNQARGRPRRPPRADGRAHPRGPAPGTNRGRDRPAWERLRYRASLAQAKAEVRARRPKPHLRKLATNPELRAQVQARLLRRHSPEQIAASLRVDYPDRPEMQVSHETLYQTLYVQGRGELRRKLTKLLRTGRKLRQPRRIGERRGTRSIPEELNISRRPPEIEDRAVPGHWEGDLITGANNRSAVGTLVERHTRFVMLLHLPNGHGAEAVRDAMLAKIRELPAHLWRTLTWDQGVEMARHAEITLATGLDIYFCDPHSPWQRGSNENTNGLLRQYLPKGEDLNKYTAADLDNVAAELNARPRKTLAWQTPAQALNKLLSDPQQPGGVATTP